MKYREFLSILADHNFQEVRQNGSHHILEGYVDGKRQVVTAAYRQLSEDILPKNMASMIRQSGLPKKLFRS